ncbi:MAG: hypothetical protein L0Y50_11500 [Beijerinckiaceae bacterium]|nr:hypothetical protein [Beijerinckiaceae bacterium]MCI0736874.1 hypothetical protein [Beijerinckiaceae bacterium]
MGPQDTPSSAKLSPRDKPRDLTADVLWYVMLAMRFVLPAAMIWLFYKGMTRS